MTTEAVGDASDPAALPDLSPDLAAEDHGNALSAQPAALVEAGIGRRRQLEAADHLQDRALRRSPAEGQLQQDALVDSPTAEPAYVGRDANGIHPVPRRCGNDGDGTRCLADNRQESASIEVIQSRAAPPPACRDERGCEKRNAECRLDE